MMLEGTGFEVIDLGTDVTPSKFVELSRHTIRSSSVCRIVDNHHALDEKDR
jgi:hypothetical protein